MHGKRKPTEKASLFAAAKAQRFVGVWLIADEVIQVTAVVALKRTP